MNNNDLVVSKKVNEVQKMNRKEFKEFACSVIKIFATSIGLENPFKGGSQVVFIKEDNSLCMSFNTAYKNNGGTLSHQRDFGVSVSLTTLDDGFKELEICFDGLNSPNDIGSPNEDGLSVSVSNEKALRLRRELKFIHLKNIKKRQSYSMLPSGFSLSKVSALSRFILDRLYFYQMQDLKEIEKAINLILEEEGLLLELRFKMENEKNSTMKSEINLLVFNYLSKRVINKLSFLPPDLYNDYAIKKIGDVLESV